MSIAPRLYMAGRCLTTIPRWRRTAWARSSAVVTTTGSISGMRPTATASANRQACSQLPRENSVSQSTIGTAAAISAISIQDTARTSRSNVVRPRV
jgi:hypothetical protein